jgi:hypothetical protein
VADDFGGAGAPPARTGGGGGGGGGLKNWPEFGFYEQIQAKNKEGKLNTYDRRVPMWFLKQSETGRKLLILDRPGKENRFSVLTHTFSGRDGKFGNVLVSIHRSDPLGDPMNDVILDDKGRPKEPSWGWALSAIDIDGRPPKAGGKAYKNQRVLLLVTEKQKDQIITMEKLAGSLRGKVLEVSRAADQQSFKIGTKFDPVETLTDDQMKERFEKVAADYGLSTEAFLEPFDYKKMLAPLPREKLVEIAEDIRSMRGARGAVKVPTGQEEGSIDF